MNRASVSIVIPVYRTPPHLLRRALECALAQTLTHIELIAVDDASPDECPQILDAIAADDQRVTVVHRCVNGKAGVARNDGLQRAEGEFVLFADADDAMRPDMCATLLDLARAQHADIAACSWAVADEEGVVRDHVILPERVYVLTSGRQKRRCYRALNYAPWNKLFRRDALGDLRFEPFEENIGEDTLFNVAALCRARRMATTSYVGYEYTAHPSSATGRSAKGMSYLRTIMLSDQRIRQTLIECDGSRAAYLSADWFSLKRYTTGCEWIAAHPHPAEKRSLWAYWRQHLREGVLPVMVQRRFLAAWYRLVVGVGNPAVACFLTRIATRMADPSSLVDRIRARLSGWCGSQGGTAA